MNVKPSVLADGSIGLLALEGRFDAYEESQVRSWLDAEQAAGRSHLIIDLSGVNFIDSTALAALVRGMKLTREAEGDLLLCALRQPVRVIFELTRLDRVFPIFADVDEAVRHFGPSASAV